MTRLEGKVAFVTGAANGIGAAICRAFVAQGARVFGADLDTQAAAALQDELGGAMAYASCDVTDSQSVEAAAAQAVTAFGQLDIVVANAATFTPSARIDQLDEAHWRKALDVNVTGVYLTCRHTIPYLERRGEGSIIITASQMARVGSKGTAAYCTTKGAVVQLAKTMALDLAEIGIRVNTLSPGGTATARLERRFGNMEDAERIWGPTHPLGRLGRPDEIANGAVFLASSESSFMTGADLLLDGGYVAQ